MTENHDYNTPAEGTTDWHIPLNENFERLDDDVEIRDSEANRGEYAPKDGALFRATDTGRHFLGDGSDWNLLDVGARALDAESITGGVTGNDGPVTNLAGANLSIDSDGSLNAATGSTGSGDSPFVNVAGVSGNDLSSRIANALDRIGHGNGGKIVVPDPGSSWQWGDDLTIDPTNYDGIEIEFHGTIEYGGGGNALTIDTGGDLGSQLQGRLVTLTGGRWVATGNPDSCWRIVDTFHGHFAPRWMDDWNNGGDAACIRVETVDNWSESNYLSGAFGDCDYALHFSTQRRDTGTTSFQDTVIEHTHVENATQAAYRFGDPGSPSDLANMCMIAPRAFNHTDGTTAFYFNGRFDGGILLAPEVEEFTSTSAKYTTGPNMNGPAPLILGGNSDDVGTVGPSIETDRYDGGHRIPRISSPASSSRGTVIDFEDVNRSRIEYEPGGSWNLT